MNEETKTEHDTKAKTDRTNSTKSDKRIIVIVLVVLAFISFGAGTFWLYSELNSTKETLAATEDTLENTERDLRVAERKIEENESAILTSEMQPKFWDPLVSTASRFCYGGGSPMPINLVTTTEKNEDESIKKYFVTTQIICLNGNQVRQSEMRFLTIQSLDGDNWEQTFSTQQQQLPGYIYDTNPEAFEDAYPGIERF